MFALLLLYLNDDIVNWSEPRICLSQVDRQGNGLPNLFMLRDPFLALRFQNSASARAENLSLAKKKSSLWHVGMWDMRLEKFYFVA